MWKLLLAGSIAGALAGCGIAPLVQDVAGATVSQSELDQAETAYTPILQLMATYRNLGFCATGTVATLAKPCASRAAVAKMVAANAVVQGEFTDLQNAITNGDNTGALSIYSLLQQGIANVKLLETATGVQ